MQNFGPDIWIAITLVTLFASIVKGLLGFALPLVMIAGLTFFMTPDLALGLLLLPTLASNLWQAVRSGFARMKHVFRTYWRYILTSWVAIAVTAQLYTILPDALLLLLIGIPITVLAFLQLAGWNPKIRDAMRNKAETAVGVFAGFLGGLSGTWGPPTTLYLTARDTPKAEQLQAQGVFYSLGSVILIGSHVKSGVFNADTAWVSAVLLIPTLIGMWIGFRLNDKIDQALFRKLTLFVVVIAGLNLVRRGIAGL